MSDTKATGGIEVSRSDDEVMAMARKRLRLALEMLGVWGRRRCGR